MEAASEADEKLHRLRLVLPDLSPLRMGNWLAVLEKSIPPDLFHSYENLFEASETTRNDGLNGSKRSHVEAHSAAGDDADHDSTMRQSVKTGSSYEVRLHVGDIGPCGPVLQTWEFCHGLENWLLEKSLENDRARTSPRTQIGSMIFKSASDDRQRNAVDLSSKSVPRAHIKVISESELVRDALYALQGVPAAVRKLENLSKTYCTTAADKSAQNLSTSLWTRSVSASALGKLLSVVARAGHVRWQLDAFVRFFLDDRLDPYEEKMGDASRPSKRKDKKNKKKKRRAEDIKEAEKQANSSSNATRSVDEKVPCHCLVNQAFAAAVKGILRGHSAALNTLASSVSLRRAQETVCTSKGGDLGEHEPGPIIGYDSRDISLLEFYLHTRELRVQLHALAFICLMREGKSFVGRSISDCCSQEAVDMKENGRKHGPGKGGKSDAKVVWCDPLRHSFDNFPRGADLLTYLYEQLMDMDPLHLELLRFLFERAYEPYSKFIQSWLYQAAVRDPYGEFIIEQADFSAIASRSMVKGKLVADPHPLNLKLRSGLYVPRFLENICSPLIRAGEQLQVLLKLAETCELAQQMAISTHTAEMLWPQSSMQAAIESGKSSLVFPAHIFSKRKLDETAKEREKKSQELSEQFDMLFIDLSSRRVKKESSRATTSHSAMSAGLSHDININAIEDNQVLGADPGQQTSGEPPSTLSTIEALTEHKDLKSTVILPERGWMTSAEGEAAAEDFVPSAQYKSQRLWQDSKNEGLAGLAIKQMNETGKTLGSCVAANVSDLQLVSQDPIELWFGADSMKGSKVIELGKESSDVQSLISGHQRGTSWTLWGLPINPFLVQADMDDFTHNTYVHPSFAGTYQHWNVTSKPTSSHTSFPNKFRESSKFRQKCNIEPHWFASLESALNNQRFAGLDTQLNFPSLGQAEVIHPEGETGLWEPAGYLDQLLVDLDKRLSNPLGVSLADYAEPEVPVALTSPQRSGELLNLSPFVQSGSDTPKKSASLQKLGDPLNFSPVVQLDSNMPAYLASPLRQTNPPSFLSDIQSESEALADITSPKHPHVQYLLRHSSLAESENASEDQRLIPPDMDFHVGKDHPEKYLTEPYPFNMDTQDSRFVEVLQNKEPSNIPKSLSRVSDAKADKDRSGDARMEIAVVATDICSFDQRKDDCCSEHVNAQPLGSDKLHKAAKWEQYLRSSDLLRPAAIQELADDLSEDEVHADEEMPLSVVVNKCITEEVLSQYKSVSTLTVRLFLEGLCLRNHYTALRRYFFMEQGDWAEYFTAALRQHRWGPLGGQHRQMEVQGMLEAALQRSSCEGDEYAERVYIAFQENTCYCEKLIHGSTETSISTIVDCGRLDAFDFIALQYRIDWPLSLILTSHSLGLYNVVFTFLMRIKLTVHALGDIWQQLRVIDQSLCKVRGSPTLQQQRNRFRTLQQFRQQIYHFVTAVQRYVESKLLDIVWSKFLQDIQLKVNDMQDLEVTHCAYLEDAINECFLCTKTRGVKGCIDSIMQCVLDFSSHMRNAFYPSGENLDLIDDGLFIQVHQVKKGFQASLQQLHSYHTKQEPQSRTNLNDLWMVLDYNGFLTRALSTTHL